MSLREQILSANDLPFEDVPVKEWGLTIRVRAITAGERDRWDQITFLYKNGKVAEHPEDVRAKLLVFACCDPETGARLFTEDDIPALTGKNSDAMNRLWAVASELSKVMNADVEKIAKNSDSAQRDAS